MLLLPKAMLVIPVLHGDYKRSEALCRCFAQ
jgi:hypothetical protein